MRTNILNRLAAGMIWAALGTAGIAAETSPLPDPILVLTGLEYYETGGKEWTRYHYRVANLADFPNELFAASPDLPPCGTNTQAARTWLDFHADGGKRLYGFCTLRNRDDLGKIWFNVETAVAPPKLVYIVLNDRLTNTTCKSNLAPTAKGPGSL